MSPTAPDLLPLRPDDEVALVVDGLGALRAVVAGATPSAVTLALGRHGLPARMLHRRRATLERTSGGRRFAGDGLLSMVAHAGRVRDDAVLFRFAARAGDPQRAFPRAPAVLPATLVPMERDIRPARALTLDLSAGGALLRAPAGLARGTEVQLHLQLPEEELPIPAAGEVVRATSQGLFGVRLDRMRPGDRDLVLRWVTSQATRARASRQPLPSEIQALRADHLMPPALP